MNPPDSQPQPQKKRSYQNSTENQRAMQQERNRQYRKRCKMAAESLQLEFDNLRQLHMITSTELQEKQEVLELQREIMNLNEAIRRRESNWQHRLQLLANQARGTQPLVSPAEQSNPEHQRTTASTSTQFAAPETEVPQISKKLAPNQEPIYVDMATYYPLLRSCELASRRLSSKQHKWRRTRSKLPFPLKCGPSSSLVSPKGNRNPDLGNFSPCFASVPHN